MATNPPPSAGPVPEEAADAPPGGRWSVPAGAAAICCAAVVVLLGTIMLVRSGSAESDDAVAPDPLPIDPATEDQLSYEPTAGEVSQAALEPPYLGPLGFAWPTGPCAVPVSLVEVADGFEVESSFRLVLAPESDSLVVSFEDVTVDSIGGMTVTPTEQATLEAYAVIPDLVVDRAGQVVDVRRTDRSIDAILAADPTLGEVLTREDLAGMLTAQIVDDWAIWVGVWAAHGEVEDTITEIGPPAADGSPAPTFRSLGATVDGEAVLQTSTRLADDELAEEIGLVLSSLPPGLVNTADVVAGLTGRMDTVLETVVDPATLQPSSVWAERTTRVRIQGQVLDEQSERTWRFDWDAGGCAGPV